MIFAALFVALLLGVHGAYQGALFDATNKLGRAIAHADISMVDAITPPSSTTYRAMNWTVTMGLVVATALMMGLWAAVAVYVMRIGVSWIAMSVYVHSYDDAGGFIRAQFARKIYGSLIRRHADYERDGDKMRAEAMADVISRVEKVFDDKDVFLA